MICVVYKSISGYTKQYAEMIAKELSCDIYDASTANVKTLENYETIIFGGSLHAVGINGLKAFKYHLNAMDMTDKNLIIFAVGASPDKPGIAEEITAMNLADLNEYKFFYMRGGFDYSKLDLKNKFLMTLLKFKLKIKKDRNIDEIGMLNAYEHPVNFVNQKHIDALVAYVHEIKS